jgi:Protein of unknown function (DUF1573)
VRRAGLAVLALLWVVGSGYAEEPKTSPAPTGPKIAVEPPTFDFGKALQNKTLQKEFSIRNYGTQDLTIENVTTTCGCTAALTESKTVKPGGSTPLRVSLQTRSYTGKLVRKVMVRSNDPSKGLLEVQVEANVVAP